MLMLMSARKYREWLAYYDIEPFGEKRADLRSAIIASTMANAWRNKGTRRFKLNDFMIKFEKSKPPTGDALYNKIRAATLALGGTVVDKRNG